MSLRNHQLFVVEGLRNFNCKVLRLLRTFSHYNSICRAEMATNGDEGIFFVFCFQVYSLERLLARANTEERIHLSSKTGVSEVGSLFGTGRVFYQLCQL